MRCCCQTIENLYVFFLKALKVSKESKAERAVEDVESANITESHESTESHENDERIESIERNGQKEKVTGNVNKASESSLVLCEGKGVDNHTEIVQRLVVTIRNRKIVRCLVANAYLAFVPRRAWSACVLNYMRGYWCLNPITVLRAQVKLRQLRICLSILRKVLFLFSRTKS